jgi:hypothetical protein
LALEEWLSGVDMVCFTEICDERDDRVTMHEVVVAAFDNWRPGVEGGHNDIRLEVAWLNKH